jgi:hypothetical protein
MLVVPPVVSLNASKPLLKFVDKNHKVRAVPVRVTEDKPRISTAVVYCEANFGEIDGKTANGLIRRSEKYKILSVIDSK